jgi:hypothetical protein
LRYPLCSHKRTLTTTLSALGLLLTAFTQDVFAMYPHASDDIWGDAFTALSASRPPEILLPVVVYQEKKAEGNASHAPWAPDNP